MVFSLHFCPTELLSVLRSNISKTTNDTSNAGPLCRHKMRVLARYTAGEKKRQIESALARRFPLVNVALAISIQKNLENFQEC